MRSCLSLLFLLTAAAVALAQPVRAKSFADVAEVTAKFDPPQAKAGEKVKLLVTVSPKPGAYTYAVTQPNGQDAKLTVAPPQSDAVTFVAGPIADPPGWKDKDGAELGTKDRVYTGPVTWELTGTVNAGSAGKKTFTWAGTRIQACNKDNCFYSKPSDLPTLEFEVLPGGTAAPPPTPPQTKSTTADQPKAEDPPKPGESPSAAAPTPARGGLAAFLAQAAFWGLVSLITPCVFPMIPITVSLFLKQSNQSAGGAVKLAAVYCGTIVLVLGVAATFVLKLFVDLSRSPYTNVALAALLLVFALSLFGWYDIRLPNFLLRGAEAKRKQGGLIGTVFGAIAFSIVSFTCVAPFLGGFAGLAAQGGYSQLELLLGGLTFGVAFAAPFFVLALFPTLMKKLPRSGGWLDTVKAVMGFLELAAAFKFARTAELLWLDPPQYFTYDLCLAAFAVISAACGLYLLGLFRLPHDDEPTGKLSVPKLLFALTFLGLGVYLFPGTIHKPDGENQRPKGVVFAWVDSFLLPDEAPEKSRTIATGAAASSEGAVWSRDLDAEVARIGGELRAKPDGPRPAKSLIFLDFTGVTCSNCKLNERDVFPKPQVAELLAKYTLVQLYTDKVPEHLYRGNPPGLAERNAEAERNRKLQDKMFGTDQLPLYVVLEPQASGEPKVLGVYPEGKINDVPAFVEFLRQPLAK
jgi:thiol:disulfide interchange protein DsbD